MRRLVAGIFIVAGCAPPDNLVLPEAPGDTLLLGWQNDNGNKALVLDPKDDSVVNFSNGKLWMMSLPGEPSQLQLTTGNDFPWGSRDFVTDWSYQFLGDDQDPKWEAVAVPKDLKLPAFQLGECLAEGSGLRSQSCLTGDSCDVFGSPVCVPVELAAEDFEEPRIDDPSCFKDWQKQDGQVCRPPMIKDQPCPPTQLMAQGEAICTSIWDRVALPAPGGVPVFHVQENAVGGSGCGDVNQPCATLLEFEAERADQDAVVELRGEHDAIEFSGAFETLIRGDGAARLNGEMGVPAGALLVVQQVDILGRVVTSTGGSVRLLQVNLHSEGGAAIDMTGGTGASDLLVVSESRISASLPPTFCRAEQPAEECVHIATIIADGLDSVVVSSSEVQGDINILARDVTSLEVTNSRLLTEEQEEMDRPASAGVFGFRVDETLIEASGVYNAGRPAVYINNAGGDIATTIDITDVQIVRSSPEEDERPFASALSFEVKADTPGEHRLSVSGLYGRNLGPLLYASHFDEFDVRHVFGEGLRGGVTFAGRRRIDALIEDMALFTDRDPAIRIEAAGDVLARRVWVSARSIHDPPQAFGTIVGTRRAVKGLIDSEGFGRAIPRFTGESLVLTATGTAVIRGSFEDITLTDSRLQTYGDWVIDQADNFAGPRLVSMERVSLSSNLAGLRQPDASIRATNLSFNVGPAPGGVGPLVCSAVDRVYDFGSIKIRHSDADDGLFWLLTPISGLEVERPLLRNGVLELGGDSPQFAREVETCVTDSLGEPLSGRAHQVRLEEWVAR